MTQTQPTAFERIQEELQLETSPHLGEVISLLDAHNLHWAILTVRNMSAYYALVTDPDSNTFSVMANNPEEAIGQAFLSWLNNLESGYVRIKKEEHTDATNTSTIENGIQPSRAGGDRSGDPLESG